MAGSILGTRVLRQEDPRFMTVGGVYTADLRGVPELTGAATAVYVRSTVAHGTIAGIDTSEAEAMPGVVGVFTAASLGLEPHASPWNRLVRGTLLAGDRVRYVGEPVAVVLAESAPEAVDAAEVVFVDYELLEAYVDPESALSGATTIFDGVAANVVMDSVSLGMPELSGADFFAGCEVVVSGRFVNQRLAPCPLETRSSAAVWVDGRLHQWLSSQNAHRARARFARINQVAEADVHIIVPDVGGGFGAKIAPFADEALLGRLAREIARPVLWSETRSESMMALGHGRGQIQKATVGGSRDGRVTHYRLDLIQDCGATAEIAANLPSLMTRPMASGVYDIPQIECRTRSVLTNTTPVVAYRGAGRPEATAAIERAMDLFAAELGLDPVEVRRINLIAPFDRPHTTAIGQTYDVGDYAGALDRVLAAAGYEGLRAEQHRRREVNDPRLLGIGVSVYVEITGGVAPLGDDARIDVTEDGGAVVFTGSSPHGQGHETAWAMIASERTGIPMDHINVVWGDTDVVPRGGGTAGSRSLQHAGAAVDKAAGELVELAKALTADELEANLADIVLDADRGVFHVAGTPGLSRSWSELSAASTARGESLTVQTRFDAAAPTFPFGAHVAVVEIDSDTGLTRLVRHIACDDAGRILNPLIVEGQIHGGIAQGAAQALLEEVRFDRDGNPITSNLADYAMISAAELPSFEVVEMETPTPVNPLGAKGIGESGTIGSTPAVQSAVVDALGHLGVRHLDMPATPERVWRAIREASD